MTSFQNRAPQDDNDNKSSLCIPFILERLSQHRKHTDRPFVIGLNGLQGVGKTTLVTALRTTLQSPPRNLVTLSFSLDDLYLPHDRLNTIAVAHPSNPLLQHRGQPGTHDVKLGRELFSQLLNRERDIKVPTYDKSAHHGRGDRVPVEKWEVVNKHGESTVDVVLFEAWCVGFRSLSDQEVVSKWLDACGTLQKQEDVGALADDKVDRSKGRLGRQKLESVKTINENLKEYDTLTDQFDTFIHLDADDTINVYDWRLEAEAKIRASRGDQYGMTDEEVIDFVNGYYPSYELYTDRLRKGVFEEKAGSQLRIIVDKQRHSKSHEVI
ncbi:MAG: hypothetical protein M1831_005067 [Alyxoria varia]|nr:MAG: hypothetical protein M1831_005067 [Alyxoria varia]